MIIKNLKFFHVFSFKLSLFSLLFSLFSLSAFAGQPWLVDVNNSGTPARWGYNTTSGKWTLRWKVDPGPLTDGRYRINSSQAVRDYIQPILTDWASVQLPVAGENGAELVQTVAIEFIAQGEVSSDVTVSDYATYAFPDEIHPPPTVAIFDADGSIIADYCVQTGGSDDACYGVSGGSCRDEDHPAGARNCTVGMGKPFADSTSKIIRHGFIFLNGRLIDGIASADNGEASPEQFKAVIKHEFGHLLNLDHSQVNAEASESCDGDDCSGAEGIVTMFPSLKTVAQETLHWDDKVAISWLYPTPDFLAKFCVIRGEIKNQEDKGIQGVNVIAKNIGNPTIDARSMVSGVLYAPGTEDGHYILSGITPGETYEVSYEELIKHYNEKLGSGFGPLEADSPTGFGIGTIAGSDGSSQVHCNNGGETIEMTPLKLNVEVQDGKIIRGEAISGALNASGGGAGSGEKKGWCFLTPQARFNFGSAAEFFALFSLVLILSKMRLNWKSEI